jgi:hypothetical protein
VLISDDPLSRIADAPPVRPAWRRRVRSVSTSRGVPRLRNLAGTLAICAALWIASFAGYFWLVPVLDAPDGYNDAPVAFALYYAAWVAVTIVAFRRTHFAFLNADVLRKNIGPVVIVALILYVAVTQGIPNLPGQRIDTLAGPSEVYEAGSSFFLPKSVEIVFQQVLIVAILLALSTSGLSVARMSLLVGLLFGGFHLTLLYVYAEPSFAYRYAIAATVFGAMVPYMILKIRHGYLLSYGIHWCFYVWLALLNKPA